MNRVNSAGTTTQPGTLLREWRLRHRLTVEEVGALVGKSGAMISLAERGQRSFAPLTKVTIARRLGVPLRELFELEEIEETGS